MKIKSYLFLILCALFVASPLLVKAEEYPFDANQIISDEQMFDFDSMNLGQIQLFLQDKGSSLAWLITEDKDGNLKTAAEIIYMAANEYKVNPKLLLAFLQKEQSLITLENPQQSRLDWAMGYGACDGCSASNPKVQKYMGFGKQVDNAAGAMRFYTDHANDYAFVRKAGESVTIDGSPLIIGNQATANLYTYTPHIWGNELFSYLFNKYFGDPLASDPDDAGTAGGNVIIRPGQETTVVEKPVASQKYKLKVVGQGKDEIWANEGEQAYYWVEYENTGLEIWNNQDLNNLYLLKESDLEGSIVPKISDTSLFNNAGVLASLPMIKVGKTEVKPGEILRVTVKVDPSYIKTESFSYLLVLGGHGYFPESEINFTLTRVFNYDAQLTYHNYPNTAEANSEQNIEVVYKNVGKHAWYKKDVSLEWTNITKNIATLAQMQQEVVNPGESATFKFTTHLSDAALYEYSLELYKKVGEKYNLFPTGAAYPKIAANIDASVNNSDLLTEATTSSVRSTTTVPVNTFTENSPVYETAITDGSFQAEIVDMSIPVGIKQGQTVPAYITVKNTGHKVWTKGNMVLRSYRSVDPFKGSQLYDYNTWLTSMAVGKTVYDVKPGESYTFKFNLRAPYEIGMIKHYWQLEWGDNYEEVPMNGEHAKIYNTFINE